MDVPLVGDEMNLIQKFALCADNGAESVQCSAVMKGDGEHLAFNLSRAEFCHILDCIQMDTQETVARKMVKLYASASKNIENFDGILARFVRKFGQNRVRFQVFEYLDSFGVCVKRGVMKSGWDERIAIMFRCEDRVDAVDAAIRFAEKWDAGETEYKGKSDREILEGHEISARAILAGEVK